MTKEKASIEEGKDWYPEQHATLFRVKTITHFRNSNWSTFGLGTNKNSLLKMMLKVRSVQNRQLKRFLEHGIYISIMLFLIPFVVYFELCVVLPTIAEEFTVQYFAHVICATYLLFNIVGNLIYGSCIDTSIKGKLMVANDSKWTLCTVCECLTPPRAWHCEYCNICILKRDHHCTFFATCVGYYNHRYFVLFTFYLFISMIYSVYYNAIFLAQFLTWNHGLVILKFMFPFASFFIDCGSESMYIFIVMVNVIIGMFSGFLFFYHFKNILKGKTVPETKHYTKDFLYNKGWKSNLIEVFGTRWYIAWILPFISSPLPGNGIDWIIEDKTE